MLRGGKELLVGWVWMVAAVENEASFSGFSGLSGSEIFQIGEAEDVVDFGRLTELKSHTFSDGIGTLRTGSVSVRRFAAWQNLSMD